MKTEFMIIGVRESSNPDQPIPKMTWILTEEDDKNKVHVYTTDQIIKIDAAVDTQSVHLEASDGERYIFYLKIIVLFLTGFYFETIFVIWLIICLPTCSTEAHIC